MSTNDTLFPEIRSNWGLKERPPRRLYSALAVVFERTVCELVGPTDNIAASISKLNPQDVYRAILEELHAQVDEEHTFESDRELITYLTLYALRLKYGPRRM